MSRVPDQVRSVARRARTEAGRVVRRARRALAPAPVPAPAAPPEPPPRLETARALPTPEGWSVEELQAVMRSFTIDDSPPGALDGYWQEAFGRFLHTWGLVRDEHGRLLELGANPYFLSWLLTRFTDLDLTFGNYFGAAGEITQRLGLDERGTAAELEMRSDLFNMEEDAFPYETASFDVVLFCEIVEHLLMDPLHALGEIHRILQPGGALVLTTPNAVRLENVLAMVNGFNIYDPYSGFGPYGRHNREYIRTELVRLIEFAGFEVEVCFTADSRPIDVTGTATYAAVAPSLVARSGDLGQYFFVKARATKPPREGLPRFLFRSWPEDRLVD